MKNRYRLFAALGASVGMAMGAATGQIGAWLAIDAGVAAALAPAGRANSGRP